jgi:RNA polymerase sigma-70 factor (ECF subfamily)
MIAYRMLFVDAPFTILSMPKIVGDQSSGSANAGHFATTRWSMVLEAGHRSSPKSAAALATLCESYWYPLYSFVRRQGRSADDARDLTQEFFSWLLEKNALQVADRSRGRFRSFLLASMKNFLAKEWRRGQAQRRGGGRPMISLDFDDGESRYRLEPSHDDTPENIFERQWALTLLEQALSNLSTEFEQAGKHWLFECLKMFIGGEKSLVPYRELGKQLNMSESAVKVAIHRMRRRYRALLRNEIRQTVVTDEDVDEELRHLFNTLGS